jgi:hypothetical protein
LLTAALLAAATLMGASTLFLAVSFFLVAITLLAALLSRRHRFDRFGRIALCFHNTFPLSGIVSEGSFVLEISLYPLAS